MRRRVMPVAELWDGEMRGHQVDGQRVLLVKLDGQVCAYVDRCAHLGLPLSDGELVNGEIRCRAHHYRYDARTGRGVNPKSVSLCALPVAIEDDMITVELGGGR